MSKKIIFVGPPNAGKTTLRKIFFEGENRAELIQYGLEPTHGLESIIFKLNESIGVFDLAGQENQQWFETDDKSIFCNTKILIVVMDITSPIAEILDFIKKILNIREELTPFTFIYLILHKKDLILQDKLNGIKLRIIKEFSGINSMKLAFTSIYKRYFLETLTLFMDILKTCTSRLVETEKIDFNLLKNIIELLYCVRQDSVIPKMDLIKKLKISDQNFERISKILENRKHIRISQVHDLPVYSLTDSGKKYFKNILKDFVMDGFNIETSYCQNISEFEEAPPFLGFMIADSDGITIMITEVYDGVFNEFLRSENEETHSDIELIPMFVSALEKFSSELNIRNLSGLKLRGTNIKMQTFRYDFLTISLFMNPNTNIKYVKDQFDEYFGNLFKKNKEKFIKFIKFGDVSDFTSLSAKSGKFLNKLNQKYKKMMINPNIFDIRQATTLFEKLVNFSKSINIKHSIFIQKLKKLKINLMKAIYEEDFHDIREIAGTLRKLKANSQNL